MTPNESQQNDFGYLGTEAIYLDTACQSLRPLPVIEALNTYYTSYNSCGERAKHAWGATVDKKVAATREAVLDYLYLNPKEYIASFTLNTTYGLNLILSQLKTEGIEQIVTTDIEHNSVFLPTMSFARRHDIKRYVLTRNDDGSVPLDHDFTNALVVLNAVSNIDGRELVNINELIDTVHKAHGVVVIDAAQAFAHSRHLLRKTKADAVCFSAHKAYAPSLGCIIFNKKLIDRIESSFIGGGMVEDVSLDTFTIARHEPHAVFEAGLQAYGEIVAFGSALEWLSRQSLDNLHHYSQSLYDTLGSLPKVHLINRGASPTLAFYHQSLHAHLVAEVLSDEGIMARSGYFCCHYYLEKQRKLPPLIRLSLGLHTTSSDIEKTRNVLERILT